MTPTPPQTSEFYLTGPLSDGDYSYRLCLSPSVHRQWDLESISGEILKYLYQQHPVAGTVAVRTVGIGQYSISEVGTVDTQDARIVDVAEFVRSVLDNDRIGAVNDRARFNIYRRPYDSQIIPELAASRSVAKSCLSSGSSGDGDTKAARL